MTTATATEFPTTLTNGRTSYTVERAEGSDDKRGPAFMLHGARGAIYMMVPAIDSTPERPAWVTLGGRRSFHTPFDFVTIVDGAWFVLR